MKFSVKTSDFLKAIHSIEGVISTKQIKSILSNVKIETLEDSIALSATDLEISLRTSLAANIVKPGSTSIPVKTLSGAFKTINFSDAMLELIEEEDSSQTFITDADDKNGYKTGFQCLDPEEIKTIGKVDTSNIVDFPSVLLKEMIRKTYHAVAQEETRFVFNGLYFKSNDTELTVVGTDGRRLAKISRKFPQKLPFATGIIIPHKTIRESQKLLDLAENAKVGISESQFYINIGQAELLSKLIDGTFPDYEQVIPKNSSYSIRINKEEFLIMLRQALISAEEPSRQIRITFKKDELHISASNPGSVQFENHMPIQYSGEETTIAFKGDYLSDTIKTIDDPEVEINFTNSNVPVLFKDPSDADYVAVIMPMKL
ncbi:MAG: DNA polymerase III subunit beta [Leptospira sp.]|jgi:DNA polymerase III subunit beta|nr:DNA polymerase III subunit beta [Leptospira sp.]NCS93186.1 DNA polymerase III subunit beta [Leptospira sp.]